MAAWHVDKTLNIGVVGTFALQTAVVIWWVSGLNSHVAEIDAANQRQDSRINTVEQMAQAQAVGAAATTEQISAIKDVLDQIRTDQRENNALLRQALEKQP